MKNFDVSPHPISFIASNKFMIAVASDCSLYIHSLDFTQLGKKDFESEITSLHVDDKICLVSTECRITKYKVQDLKTGRFTPTVTNEVENLDNAEITDALSNANSITINQDEITAVSSNKSRIAVGFESGLLLHTDAVSALVFYNSTIYSTGMDKKLICYDYDSKNLLYSIEFTPLTPNPAFGFCIDAREGFVAVGRGDGVVTLVQIKSRNTKVVTHLEGHTWCVMGVKFYKYYLISAGLDGRVIVWRIKDGSILDQTQLGVKIDALSILSDGQVLVGGVSKEDERHGRVHIIKFKCL